MDAALVNLGTKSMDSVLAWVMFAGVAAAAAAVLFLLGRHGHRKRKARKQAKKLAKQHAKRS
jgi:membrane protein DedA with SNARE-associated domain